MHNVSCFASTAMVIPPLKQAAIGARSRSEGRRKIQRTKVTTGAASAGRKQQQKSRARHWRPASGYKKEFKEGGENMTRAQESEAGEPRK